MPPTKKIVQNILDQLDDSATLEDVQYGLYVCQKIQRGLDDATAGRLIDHAEVEKRMDQWIGRYAGHPKH